MLDQIDAASFVLVVCTETYYRRFRGHEERGMGKGVDWEGLLITQSLYDQRSRNVRFVAVLFNPDCEKYIPEPLRGATHFTLTSEESYERLCEFLDGAAGVEPGPVPERQRRQRRTARPMAFGDAATRDRVPAAGERQGAAQTANPFRLTAIDTYADGPDSSRSPIVIAIEEEANPLREEELLRPERHLTVSLSRDALGELRQIAAQLDTPDMPLSELWGYGRRAWRVLERAQTPRLLNLINRVAGSTLPQPVAWTGRTDLLVELHRPLLAAHTAADEDVDKFLSVGYGAHFFSPIGENRHEWQVHRRPPERPTVTTSHIKPSADPRRSHLEAAASDVALLLSESPDGVWALSQAVQRQAEARIRVAVGMGQTSIGAQRINDALRRLPCICIGGDALRDERLAEALREAFEILGPRQAGPCIAAAVRKRLLAHAHASGNRTVFLAGLFWATWSWIGRPLFSESFGETLPAAAYPHLMDLRATTAKDWYFDRRKGVPESYESGRLARATDAKDLFHLYLSGAGGTGKSCFLDHVYKQCVNRPDVLAVWYRVDVPSPDWADLQERILKAVHAAARAKLGAQCEELVPTGYNDLRDVLNGSVKRLQASDTGVKQIVLFVDQLERTFESGDEPDYGRLERISGSVMDLLAPERQGGVGVGRGVRVFIASRKQYLPDFLRSSQTAAECGLEFNVLQTLSDQTEQTNFIRHVLECCKRERLLAATVTFDTAAAELLASKVKGHPLNMMLALIQTFSREPAGAITQHLIETKEYRPWEKLFHLDLQLANKDDVEWFFVLAMAHARTEIVRQEEVWWRLRLVEPKLTRRVEELKPSGVLERLWLLGFLGRTIYPRDFGGQPARFLEFFHANLRDYLLQLMGQGGGEIELPRRRCETPPAWRALDRLATAAHEWEQIQQLLPADDIAFLMEQREVTVERTAQKGEVDHPPFYLLFLRDVEEARPRLCKAANSCFAFSALVHDIFGRWAVERVFPVLDERIESCKSWLERCAPDSRAFILRYLVESKETEALDLICTAVLAKPGARETSWVPTDLWRDIATILNRPLYAARYRFDVVAAVLETAVSQTAVNVTLARLPDRVREFVATSCNANPNELTQLVSRCVDRFKGSQDLKLQSFAQALATVDHGVWLTGVVPDASLYTALDFREPAGRTRAPLQLYAGQGLRTALAADRLPGWRSEVTKRLGIPLPEFDLAEGEWEGNELELRLHGQSIAISQFYPGRVQILQRHWRRSQPGRPPEGFATQNDALQEVVLWVNASLLKQVSWESAVEDFDGAVTTWLEEVLRNSVDRYFGFDLLVEYLNNIATLRDTSQLFRGVSLQLLRQVVVSLVEERVPLSGHQEELITELQQLVTKVKDKNDVEILTQKLRERVRQALCRTFVDDSGQLAVLTLEPGFEQSLASQIASHESGRFLRIDPERALALASEVRAHLELHRENDVYPVLACIPTLRYPLSSLLRRFDPRISVLSFTELPVDFAVTEAGLLTDTWGGRDFAASGGARA
jgi:hypothetical protein